MYSQYFGNYLLNRNIVSLDNLLKAMEHQKNSNVKLGVLAINSNYMSPKEVDLVHKKQSKLDKRFGEIAIELGYISPEQLDELLGSQKNEHLKLSQSLVDLNLLSLENLKIHLENYKKDYNILNTDLSKEKSEELFNIFLNFGDSLWNKIYGNYIQLLIRNFVRFIDDTPVVFVNKLSKKEINSFIVSQNITGKFNMFTSFSGNEKSLIELAKHFSGEPIETFNDLAKDSISEFLNLHNGIFLVNLSNNGTELDLKPQVMKNNICIDELAEAYNITFSCIWGVINVIIY